MKTGISYFDYMLEAPLDRFLKTKDTIVISFGYVPDDILERLAGLEQDTTSSSKYEYYMFSLTGKLYRTSTVHRILFDSPDDDTNETTRGRLEALYNKVKKFEYFLIARTTP